MAELLREFPGKTLRFALHGMEREVSYLTRIDPLTGLVSKISEVRAARGLGISVSLDIRPVENCEFCNYTQTTPRPRIEHSGGAVSVPNRFPWEKYDWITIYPPFGQHKLLLSDLYFDDLEAMLESSYELAQLCSRDPEVLAFVDFTNWGPFAGASQQHPHSQRKSVTHTLDPVQDREWQRCRELAITHWCHPFDLLLQEERQDGRRIIYDNDIVILAAFAPSCPHELLIFPREEISHILHTTPQDRKRLIRPALGVFPALFFYCGVTDLNIAVHMAPFARMEEARRYFRWHFHIYPRRHRLPVDRAGAEMGFGTNVIDTTPESTAEVLRQWYVRGPERERIVCQGDGSPNPSLLEEFARLTSK